MFLCWELKLLTHESLERQVESAHLHDKPNSVEACFNDVTDQISRSTTTQEYFPFVAFPIIQVFIFMKSNAQKSEGTPHKPSMVQMKTETFNMKIFPLEYD
ncbi:CLUMA_CG003199, isoform A [Clunio marinus]|uniref:CLUMA_CG003199, isoform A n=1 Tax=Clunio marinus TaxID=568069 RepID=A0A1J1HPJ8_9DIPT|nr:CLUMA_CG003199, isoform A [Clunio marinus]